MEKIQRFKDLVAWQEAHKLVLKVYQLTKLFPKDEMFGLTSQLRRAVVSVSSNIAEGFTRNSKKDKSHFYSTAKGSVSEVESQLLIAKDLGYISLNDFENCEVQLSRVDRLASGLIKSAQDWK
ncbi:MAG: four helix bundle protein [Candidatus Paceibacterota bacterium]